MVCAEASGLPPSQTAAALPALGVWAWSLGVQGGGRTSRPCFSARAGQGRAGPGPQPRRRWGPRAEQAGCWQALPPGQEPHWAFFIQMRTSAHPVGVGGHGQPGPEGWVQQTQSRELGGEGIHAAAPLHPPQGSLSSFRAGKMPLREIPILLLFFYVQ